MAIDIHHIVHVKDEGDNSPNNLLALCPNCHSLVHRKVNPISKRALQVWKGLLVSLNNPNRASADVLLVLYDEQKRFGNDSQSKEHVAPQFRFSGDSLGFLAGLITSGLAEISRRFLGASMFGASHPTFEVRLTKKGMSLVTAWRDGDPEAIAATLSEKSSDVVKFGDSAKAEVIKEKGKSS